MSSISEKFGGWTEWLVEAAKLVGSFGLAILGNSFAMLHSLRLPPLVFADIMTHLSQLLEIILILRNFKPRHICLTVV